MPDDALQDPRDEFFASFDKETKKVLPDDQAVPSSPEADSQSRELFAYDKMGPEPRQPIEFSSKGPGPGGSDEIGGLLPFVVCIVVLSPLVSFVVLLIRVRGLFTEEIWAAYTTPGSEQYYVLAAPLLIFEFTLGLAVFAALLFNVRLYFCKSRLFPKVFITLLLVDLCVPVLDAWLWSFVLPYNPLYHTDWGSALAWPFIRAIVLVPYMILSEQVRIIFLE